MHIYYEITSKCNLHCDYCYNDSGINRDEHMSIQQIREIINILIEKHGLKSITLSGGEPMLHREFSDIVEFLASKDIMMILITNATLLNQYQPSFYKYFKIIYVSIHDNFDTYIDRMHLLKVSNYTDLRYNVVLNKLSISNIPHYQEIAKMTHSIIVYKLQREEGRGNNKQLLTFDDAMYIKAMYPQVFEQVFPIKFARCCYFCKEYDVYTMHADGTMSLCPSLPDKFNLGHVLTDWMDNKERVLSELSHVLQEYENKVCNTCILHSVCKGGCPESIVINNTAMNLCCKVKCDRILSNLKLLQKEQR